MKFVSVFWKTPTSAPFHSTVDPADHFQAISLSAYYNLEPQLQLAVKMLHMRCHGSKTIKSFQAAFDNSNTNWILLT
jgi:hypothetical protein